MRDTMIFYRSFFEAIKELELHDQAVLYNAIFEYGLNQNEPEISGICKTIWTLIKPNLDANIQRFMNGKKPKVKQIESKTEAKVKQTQSKLKANKDKDKDKDKEINIPALTDFLIYAKQHKPDVDENSVKLKYESWVVNNWKDGNDNKITNWKMKLLNTLPHINSNRINTLDVPQVKKMVL